MSKATQERPTIKAVVAYAETLCQRAESTKVRDLWAKPYKPSESVARKLCAQHGPEEALRILAGRAAMAERAYREEAEVAKRSLERHKRRQKDSERHLEQVRQGMTVGQRIDKALAQFSVIPAATAAQVGWSTKGSDRPSLTNHGDPGGEAKYVALKAIREIERLLDRHQRRDMEKAA